MPQLRLWKNLPEAIDAVSRAGGTDPCLSPGLDASNAAKRKFGFLPELGFGARVCTMPLSENTTLLLPKSVYAGKKMLPIDSFSDKCRLSQSAKQL